jgi:hypothetical protein
MQVTAKLKILLVVYPRKTSLYLYNFSYDSMFGRIKLGLAENRETDILIIKGKKGKVTPVLN